VKEENMTTTSSEFLANPSKAGVRICVYGSLKARGKLHHNMQSARFLGETTFPGQLFHLGSYPALRPAEGPEDIVHGEVYECPDALVRRLDSIEGHPWMYKRTPIQTANFGECEVYVYQRRLHSADKRITDGIYNVADWK
jgi:gamma-glutamylcyclotransferase (GGCT)/AIG2-like uncharacterized protein YtfP